MTSQDVATVREAAKYLGVSPGRVRQLITEEKIESELRAGARFITWDELDRYVRERDEQEAEV